MKFKLEKKHWIGTFAAALLVVIAIAFQNCGDTHLSALASVEAPQCAMPEDVTQAFSSVAPNATGANAVHLTAGVPGKSNISDMATLNWGGHAGEQDIITVSDSANSNIPSSGLENPMVCFNVQGARASADVSQDCWNLQFLADVCDHDPVTQHCLSDGGQFDALNAWFTQVIPFQTTDISGNTHTSVVLFPHGKAYDLYQQPTKMSWGDGVILSNLGRDSTGKPTFTRTPFYSYDYSDPAWLTGAVGDFDGDGNIDIAYLEGKVRNAVLATQNISCDNNPNYMCISQNAYCHTLPAGTICHETATTIDHYQSGGHTGGGGAHPATMNMHIVYGATTAHPRDMSYALSNSMPPDGHYSKQRLYQSWEDQAITDPNQYDIHLQATALFATKLASNHTNLFIKNDNGMGYHLNATNLNANTCAHFDAIDRPYTMPNNPGSMDMIPSMSFDHTNNNYDILAYALNPEIYRVSQSDGTIDTEILNVSSVGSFSLAYSYVHEEEMTIGSGNLDIITFGATQGNGSDHVLQWRKYLNNGNGLGAVYASPITLTHLGSVSNLPQVIYADLRGVGQKDIILYYNNTFMVVSTSGL